MLWLIIVRRGARYDRACDYLSRAHLWGRLVSDLMDLSTYQGKGILREQLQHRLHVKERYNN